MIINNLTVSYGDKRVFSDFSLTLGDGITCIMGESGKGKTTLLHTIAGLIEPDSGCISGRPEKIALMFQDDRLFPWLSVLGNVMVANDSKEASLDILNKMELSDVAEKMPSSLSGGMRRRVSLARALAFNAELLILDEPFKGLDPALTERIAAVIRQAGVPVIVATHDEKDVSLLSAEKIMI